MDRQQQMGKEIAFRVNAAFAKPAIYEALEEHELGHPHSLQRQPGMGYCRTGAASGGQAQHSLIQLRASRN
jgi:hypothetical protein